MADTTTPNTWTQLLDKVPALFWAVRENPSAGTSEWLHFSPRLAAMYELRPEEARHLDELAKHVFADDGAEYQRRLAASRETGAPICWSGRVQTKDGSVRVLEQKVYFERQTDGDLLCWGQTVDVTERTEAEPSLAELGGRSAESVYRQIIELLPVGVLVANQRHEFPIANDRHLVAAGGRVDGVSDLSAAYGLFMADGRTPFPIENGGMVRAARRDRRGRACDPQLAHHQRGANALCLDAAARRRRDDLRRARHVAGHHLAARP